jgi:hypothetical protein
MRELLTAIHSREKLSRISRHRHFEDNMVTYFDQYQKATNSSPWTLRGNSYLGLSRFYSDAAAGTLPEVSYIVGPAELSERYPYLPIDGAWLQRKVVESIIDGAAYNETVLIISYDGKQPTPESTWLSIKLNRIQRSEAMGNTSHLSTHQKEQLVNINDPHGQVGNQVDIPRCLMTS